VNTVAFVLRAVQLAREAGLTVTFEPGWETRGNGYAANYVGFLAHHTGTASSLANPFPTHTTLRVGRSDLQGPLCNSAGPADGSVHVMAANPANHAGASGGRSMGPLPVTGLFNPRVWGHEIDYAGTVPMRPEQYRAATVWARCVLTALTEAGQIPRFDPERARLHAETSVTGKWDPGDAPGHTISGSAFRAAVATPPTHPHRMKEDVMYIKCQGKGTAILAGPIFVGLGSKGELDSADAAITAGATVQWVEPVTWDAIDARSKALFNSGLPVRTVQ
jgi:hypothetical protein